MKKNIEVNILNQSQSKTIPLSKVKQIAVKILESLGFTQVAITVVLVGDAQIRKLNRQYLNHDRPTDVIAFGDPEDFLREPTVGLDNYLGDIVVSVTRARSQAPEFGNDFFYELMFYVCHGILHLIGFRDKTQKDAKRMNQLQTELLDLAGFSRVPTKGRRI